MGAIIGAIGAGIGFFLVWGIFVFPCEPNLSCGAIIAGKFSDAKSLGPLDDPDRPLRVQARTERREAAQLVAEASKETIRNPLASGGTNPENWGQRKTDAARMLYRFNREEKNVTATLNGNTVAEVEYIRPWSFWTDTRKEVRKRATITVGGCMYGGDSSDHPLYRCVGPQGWTDTELRAVHAEWVVGSAKNQPFHRIRMDLPYLSAIGRIRKDDGSYGPTFYVGPGMIADPDSVGDGVLELGINEIDENQFHQPINNQLGDNNVGGQAFSFTVTPLE